MPDKYTMHNSLESEKLWSAWNINLFQIEESDYVAEPITSSPFPEMLIKGEYCLFLIQTKGPHTAFHRHLRTLKLGYDLILQV